LHRAAAAVELGEGAMAISVHESLDQAAFQALLPERRAHHYLDMARGYAQVGEVERAGDMLLEGDLLAPAEIRCRPIAHEVMSDVLRRTRGTPTAALAELAEQMGVGV
jgi:lipopolysaccharide biosynthesis regulator YciM